MYHGIYVRRRPKSKWFLITITQSVEKAIKEKEKYIEKCKSEGDLQAEVRIKTFSSSLYIPEILKDIDENEQMFS